MLRGIPLQYSIDSLIPAHKIDGIFQDHILHYVRISPKRHIDKVFEVIVYTLEAGIRARGHGWLKEA